MNEYRITKYDPRNRIGGNYDMHEWTSMSDIGKVFHNGVLTHSQYKKVEQAYVDCCIALIRQAGILEFNICCPEYYESGICFPSQISSDDDIRKIVMCCLQERCWAKLEADCFYIHFGYDYYMYIGTDLPFNQVNEIASSFNLFCESFISPYKG